MQICAVFFTLLYIFLYFVWRKTGSRQIHLYKTIIPLIYVAAFWYVSLMYTFTDPKEDLRWSTKNVEILSLLVAAEKSVMRRGKKITTRNRSDENSTNFNFPGSTSQLKWTRKIYFFLFLSSPLFAMSLRYSLFVFLLSLSHQRKNNLWKHGRMREISPST